MAKKRRQTAEEEERQSRKQVLLARKQERQTRQIRLAIAGVITLLAVVLLIGVVNEVIIKPQQPVATVNDVDIRMRDWQRRTRFQRAQLIVGIEDLAEAFGQDIGQVQQFAGQQINLLLDPQTLGQLVLDQTIDEELIKQGAIARGIEITDGDVEKEIEESYNYFDGLSPTALPTPTDTVMPTPSLTPIPTAVITEVVPTNTPAPTPTPGPTSTPFPTPTAVSIESFQESLAETLGQFDDLGSDEVTFREVILAQLYRERLREALAEEEGLSPNAEKASLFYLAFTTEEEAQNLLEEIEADGYLPAWNRVRSRPPDPSDDSTAVANEILWRTQEDISSILGEVVGESAFELEIGEPSGILVVAAETEEGGDRFYIVMVSGREIRPLSEREIENLKDQILSNWLEGQRTSGVDIFDRWRLNVPQRPVLDPRFLVPPTPAPPTPTSNISTATHTPES